MLAALASGGIHLAWPVLWTAAAALAGFTFWQACADKEFARRVAERSLWSVLLGPLTALTVIWLLQGADILAGWNAAEENHGAARNWVLHYDGRASWAAGMGFIALLFLRWALRASWAGKLAVNASSRRSRLLGIVALLTFAFVPAKVLLWGAYSGHLSFPLSTLLQPALDALPWTLLYLLSGRLEIRESGIVTTLGFYQWSKIESYQWYESGLPLLYSSQRLKVRISRLLPFLPAVSLRIPPARQKETELALARFLSQWPETNASGR